MRVYHCPKCRNRVWFNNCTCTCGLMVGYDPDADAMVSEFTPCTNRDAIGCNWTADGDSGFCRSCSMTRTHPDMAVDGNAELWTRAEAAKRWVIANLVALGWFGRNDAGDRPVFKLLSETTRDGPARTVMGHADGLITINVSEADPAEIVARRERMEEPYRTMIGHFRHEIAHFLFLRLAAENEGFEVAFRVMFGDEREDYGGALKRHYAAEDDGGWRDAHISHYASAHPHEDWAETAAHVMHLTDLLDSAQALGFTNETPPDNLAAAMDIGLAVNHLNRSMGMEDAYPFVVTEVVRQKLDFAAEALDRSGRQVQS